MSRTTKVALALAALSFTCSSAFAASSASASITGLSFQLYDLNPLDGPATYSFAGGSTSLSMSASDSVLGDSDSASRTRSGFLSFTKEYSTQLDNVAASASISPAALLASGSASGPSTNFNASATTGVGGGTFLTLSPKSILVITASAQLLASASNPAACVSGNYYYYSCNPSESATAQASMSLSYSYSSSSGSASVNYSDTASLSASARGAYDASDYYDWYYCYYYGVSCGGGSTHYDQVEESKSDARTFQAVFMNTSDVAQTASFYLSTGVSGTATSGLQTISMPMATAAMTATVPEPESYALVLAGVGVVGLMMSRRRVS